MCRTYRQYSVLYHTCPACAVWSDGKGLICRKGTGTDFTVVVGRRFSAVIPKQLRHSIRLYRMVMPLSLLVLVLHSSDVIVISKPYLFFIYDLGHLILHMSI